MAETERLDAYMEQGSGELHLSPNQSLVTRIVGYFLLLSAVSVVLVSIATYILAQQDLQQSVYDRLEVAVTLKENALNRWVDDNQTDILSVSQSAEFSASVSLLMVSEKDSPEYQETYFALEKYLAAFLANHENVQEMMIMREGMGEIVFSTDKEEEGARSLDNFFFRGQWRTYIENIHTSARTERPTMVISTPVYDPIDNRLLGVLAAYLKLEGLDEIILERVGLGETGMAYLVSEDNLVLPEAQFSGEAFAGIVETEAAVSAKEGQDGFAKYMNYQGVPVLGVYHWLDEREIAIITEISQEEAFAPAAVFMRKIFGLSLGASLLLAGGAYLVGLQITRPIRTITDTALLVEGGDLTIQAPVVRSDEVGILATTFNRMTMRLNGLVNSLESKVSDRDRALERQSVRLQMAAEVASVMASTRDLEQYIQQVALLIGERLGYYHVGIFMMDEAEEYAVLRASNSTEGQRMLARGYRVAVGEEGVIGYVADHRTPHLERNVGQGVVFLNPPDLPETRSEMGFPLLSSGKLLGVMDVHSRDETAFTDEEVTVLQVLAQYVAAAIENASLVVDIQDALELSRRAYGEVSRQAWLKILRARPDIGYLCDRQGRIRSVTQRWTEDLIRARASSTATQLADNKFVVPFKVHGQPIGVVQMSKPANKSEWSKKEIDLVEVLAGNLGEALESAQLYSDSQRRATRERLVGEITAGMRESLDVDTVLRTAVQQIRRALNLASVEVRLSSVDVDEGEDVLQEAEDRGPSEDTERATIEFDGGGA